MSDTTELVTQNNETTVDRRTGDQARRRMTLTPPVDIFEDTQSVTLWADLPGVTKERLDIKVSDGNLYIEAESVVSTPKGFRLQHSEVHQPYFVRAFSLGGDLDVTKIDAILKDGVLKLTIPRREEARPRRIEVHAG